ncbi:putative Sodium:sulfate symporter [Escherichia coli]|nr:putative Sodium:sulfate symporter [Escherichia coli]
MNKKSLWKLILILAIPCIIGFMPAPAGLSELAWVLFGIYLAAIVGLVIKPFPEPVVLLIAVAASMVVVGNLSDGAFKTTAVLSGYSSGTTWLVFSAFTLSAAFVTTGLGKRIAYLLIGKIGNTTLGLGYVTVFLDLVLAPATPSNTARAGGIVLPIINSVAVALGSEPEKSPRRVGHYLMMSIYMVTKTTSYRLSGRGCGASDRKTCAVCGATGCGAGYHWRGVQKRLRQKQSHGVRWTGR